MTFYFKTEFSCYSSPDGGHERTPTKVTYALKYECGRDSLRTFFLGISYVLGDFSQHPLSIGTKVLSPIFS